MSIGEQGFRRAQRQLAAAFRCHRCGKKTTVANVAGYRQSFRDEAVTLDTHCACADTGPRGGPARHLIEDSIDRGGHCAVCGVEFEHDHGFRAACDACWQPELAEQEIAHAHFNAFPY